MGREIELKRRYQAGEAYITGEATARQMVETTGISLSTLRRWSRQDGWTQRRREYRKRQLAERLAAVK